MDMDTEVVGGPEWRKIGTGVVKHSLMGGGWSCILDRGWQAGCAMVCRLIGRSSFAHQGVASAAALLRYSCRWVYLCKFHTLVTYVSVCALKSD
jgi:hypothetical protein